MKPILLPTPYGQLTIAAGASLALLGEPGSGTAELLALLADRNEPEIVLLAEPFAGLAPPEATLRGDQLRARSAQGATLVIATRYLAVAADLAERIVLVEAGRIVYDLPTADLLRQLRVETYELRVRGHLPPDWTDYFDGFGMQNVPSGECILRGPIADQAALHGVITTVRTLGLELCSLTRCDPSIAQVIAQLQQPP